MSTEPTLSDLLLRLSRATEWIHARWRRELGISAYELLALLHLHERSMTVGELGERLALTSGAMTGLVDRLEKHDFVTRVRSSRDRRRVNVELTTATATRLGALQRQLAESISTGIDDVGRMLESLASIVRTHEAIAEGGDG